MAAGRARAVVWLAAAVMAAALCLRASVVRGGARVRFRDAAVSAPDERDALRARVSRWERGFVPGGVEVIAEGEKGAGILFFVQVSAGNVRMAPRLVEVLIGGVRRAGRGLVVLHFDGKMGEEVDVLTGALERWGVLVGKDARGVVALLPRTAVTYTGVSMLLNTLEAIEYALRIPDWDYFLNLSAGDYPLVSVKGMGSLLGGVGALSFVHFSDRISSWGKLAAHRLGSLHFDLGLGGGQGGLVETGARHPVLHMEGALRLILSKGEAWVTLHRSFCESAVRGAESRRLVALMSSMQSSPEHFFQTLAWNVPQLNRTTAHHSMREIAWGSGGQHPLYLDDVGRRGEYVKWTRIARSPHFFARKFRVPDSPLLDHIDRVKSGVSAATPNATSVVQSFALVKNRFACVADVERQSKSRYICTCFWSGWAERACKGGVPDVCPKDMPAPGNFESLWM